MSLEGDPRTCELHVENCWSAHVRSQEEQEARPSAILWNAVRCCLTPRGLSQGLITTVKRSFAPRYQQGLFCTVLQSNKHQSNSIVFGDDLSKRKPGALQPNLFSRKLAERSVLHQGRPPMYSGRGYNYNQNKNFDRKRPWKLQSAGTPSSQERKGIRINNSYVTFLF